MWSDPSKQIPTSNDPAENWIAWHRLLLKWFSKDDANAQWVRFWSQRGGAGTKADTYDLRFYMRKQGVDITTDVGGEITDAAKGVANWFADSFNAIRYLIFGVVIIAIGIATFYVISNIKKGKSMGEMALAIKSLKRSAKLSPILSQNQLT